HHPLLPTRPSRPTLSPYTTLFRSAGDALPKIDHLENHEFDYSVELLKKAGELGLLGVDVPEEYGGLALDKISSSLITEKFARAGDRKSTRLNSSHVSISYAVFCLK